MLTAGAGRLVSPFTNDPFALVALAFKNLYPEREYAAYPLYIIYRKGRVQNDGV